MSFPQIALAIGVLTSSIGVRFADFLDSFWGGLSGRVSSEVLSDVCMGEGSQIQGKLSGRVSSEVLSDVCMGEGSQIQGKLSGRVSCDVCGCVHAIFLDSFWGAAGFFNVVMQTVFFRVCCCLAS